MMDDTPGQRLRRARENAGFDTVVGAARACGLHPQNLSDHEADRRRIVPERALEYESAFGCNPAWLTFGPAYGPPPRRKGARPPDVRELVGANVARLREARGLTHEQLEELSGFPRQYINALERGRRNPTVVTLYEFAMALGVGLEDLVRDDGEG